VTKLAATSNTSGNRPNGEHFAVSGRGLIGRQRALRRPCS